MKKIKMKTGKKIDWHKLVGDLLDFLFYSQQDLSDLCQTLFPDYDTGTGIKHENT
jgi:hypothetical protein